MLPGRDHSPTSADARRDVALSELRPETVIPYSVRKAHRTPTPPEGELWWHVYRIIRSAERNRGREVRGVGPHRVHKSESIGRYAPLAVARGTVRTKVTEERRGFGTGVPTRTAGTLRP